MAEVRQRPTPRRQGAMRADSPSRSALPRCSAPFPPRGGRGSAPRPGTATRPPVVPLVSRAASAAGVSRSPEGGPSGGICPGRGPPRPPLGRSGSQPVPVLLPRTAPPGYLLRPGPPPCATRPPPLPSWLSSSPTETAPLAPRLRRALGHRARRAWPRRDPGSMRLAWPPRPPHPHRPAARPIRTLQSTRSPSRQISPAHRAPPATGCRAGTAGTC
mmetsp:Transcript_17049/g.48009  ORF Transcript_17049/g.48009 Transcript_17049/m.48009 type:complete len:216 (+) Transcript_17049:3580-4227(+)